MTKTLAIAMGAMLLLAGTQMASASCPGDAAASRDECLRDHGNPGECAAMYSDDLRECSRYEHAPMPMHKPVAKAPPKPAPAPQPFTPRGGKGR
jgi:hypothetical protein